METRLAAGSIENARLWLAKLKKNEDEVGITTLQSKYQKGYMTLLSRSRAAVEEVLTDYIKLAIHNVEDLSEQADAFIETARQSGLFTRAWNLAYQDKTLDAAFEAVLPSFLQLQQEVYQPYWLSHVQMINGRYYNDLIDAYWTQTGDAGFWSNDVFSMIGLPPTAELCEKQMKQLLPAA